MAKIEKTEKGFVIIKTTVTESYDWGGYGICDNCNKVTFDGVLIPVLNMWFCEKCYKNWYEHAEYYPEDKEFEEKKLKYYKGILNATGRL